VEIPASPEDAGTGSTRLGLPAGRAEGAETGVPGRTRAPGPGRTWRPVGERRRGSLLKRPIRGMSEPTPGERAACAAASPGGLSRGAAAGLWPDGLLATRS